MENKLIRDREVIVPILAEEKSKKKVWFCIKILYLPVTIHFEWDFDGFRSDSQS